MTRYLFGFHKYYGNRNNASTEVITTLTKNFPNFSAGSCHTAAVKGGTPSQGKSQHAGR